MRILKLQRKSVGIIHTLPKEFPMHPAIQPAIQAVQPANPPAGLPAMQHS